VKRQGLFLIVIYLVTRLVCWQLRPVYYDAFEYVRVVDQAREMGVVAAVVESHQPVHTLYLLMAGGLGEVTGWTGAMVLAVLSLLAGLTVVIGWNGIVKEMGGSWWSGLVLLLLPGMIVINTNIMYEGILLMFQVWMVWAMVKYLRLRQGKWLVLSGVLAGLGQLVTIGNWMFWLPLILYWKWKRELSWKEIIEWGVGMGIVAGAVDWTVLGSISVVWEKYSRFATSFVSANGGIIVWWGRVIRNALFAGWNLLGPVGVGLIGWGIWKGRKDGGQWIWRVILISALVAVQYWHFWYWGRVGISMLLATAWWGGEILLRETGWKRWVVIILLVAQAGWAINTQLSKNYIQALEEVVREKTEQQRWVTSDSVRMAYEEMGVTPLLIIRQGESDLNELKELVEQGEVWIDEAALTYPYWQPDGWGYQMLSRRDGEMPINKWVEEHCEREQVVERESQPILRIFRVSNCDE